MQSYKKMDKIDNWIIGIILIIIFVTLLYLGINSDSEKKEKSVVEFNSQSSDINMPLNDSVDKKVIVKTLNGYIEGKTLQIFNSNVYTFLGIPYAEPPIGKLRFSSPKPIKGWSGVRQTKRFTPMCSQIIVPVNIMKVNYITHNISEDCLNLNIWTPEMKPKKLKTVMVWIHGGGFVFNSANIEDTDGQMLASFGDVVVVSINYRVGVFGFLNTRTEETPGNMGIYDQTLALHWIKDNIERFGGDPNKIVPFGESAGAISIGILMTFNKTRNLFSRAITQSGSFLMPQTSKTFENSKKFANLIGCLDDNLSQFIDSFPDEAVDCIKKTSFSKIYEAANSFLKHNLMPFMPSIDSYYEDIENPMDYLQEENSYSNMKELMTGLVRDEGTIFMLLMNPRLFKRQSYPKLRTLSETRQMFVDLIKNKTEFPEDMVTVVAESFIAGPKSDSPEKNIKRFARPLGDFAISCPTIYLADELVARNKSVYMYLFNHRPNSSEFGEWIGVGHYQEVPFVFGYPIIKPDLYSKEDIEFSKTIMKIWSHFAKTGKVKPQFGKVWPKYSEENSFMVLNSNKSSIEKSFHSKSCDFYKLMLQVNGR